MRRDGNYTIGHPAEEPYGHSIRFISEYVVGHSFVGLQNIARLVRIYHEI